MAGTIRARLEELGLELPPPMQVGPGTPFPFVLVRIDGHRAVLSGHVPLAADGSIAEPLGKLGAEVDIEAGQQAAARCVLGMLASLEAELGDLDRIECWVKLLGMVNAAPGFTQLPQVINGASQLLLDVFGEAAGSHARSAVGLAELPMNVPVEIEGEALIRG